MAILTGRNLSVLNLATNSLASRIRECQLEHSYDTQENRAVTDKHKHPLAVIEDWTLTFKIAVESTLAFDTGSKTNMTKLQSMVGQSVAITFDAADAANNGTRYTGTGLLQRGTHSQGYNTIQEGDFTVQCQSALTVTQL